MTTVRFFDEPKRYPGLFMGNVSTTRKRVVANKITRLRVVLTQNRLQRILPDP